MRHDEYARFDAVGLRELVSGGQVSVDEVASAAREAIALAQDRVNGATQVFDTPLEYDPDGPFAGVPFMIKDSQPMAAGVEFTIGSRALDGIRAAHDSDLMKRFRAAGLATYGVTTVPEMCLSFATESVRYGVTRNPFDPSRGVGGSSGGAAAMVAAGAVPVAHANDAAGSIRIPASCCGLVGLKPSRGRVPTGPDTGDPVFGMAYEFAVTRTVRDTAHLLDLVQGPAVGDKYTAPPPLRPYVQELTAEPGALRVALSTTAWSGVAVDPEVAAAAVRVAATLEQLGMPVVEASPAVDWDDVFRASHGEINAVAEPWLTAPRQPPADRLEAVSRAMLAEAVNYRATDLMACFAAQNRVTRAVGAFFTEYDLLVTPTIGQLPAPNGTYDYDDPSYTVDSWLTTIFAYGPFTLVFNVSGQPAISLPLGRSASGLPIGVQLVAPYGREDVLLRVAAKLEEAMAIAGSR
ncbi:amidase family protein [Kibdelosporangium lantanae]